MSEKKTWRFECTRYPWLQVRLKPGGKVSMFREGVLVTNDEDEADGLWTLSEQDTAIQCTAGPGVEPPPPPVKPPRPKRSGARTATA